MADLADITGAPDAATTLRSFILTPWDMADYGSMEREWEAKRLARAKVLADGLRSEVADKALQRAEQEIADGMYAFGSPWFDQEVLKVQNAGFLTWLSARHAHPSLTRVEVDALFVTSDPDVKAAGEATHDRVLSLGGYGVRKKKGETGNGKPTSPSTGGPSSDSLASAAVSPSTSADASPSLRSTPPSASTPTGAEI